MPLYEYKCNSCGETFEIIQKFSDEPITVHEECGGATERLLSAPAFHLKGSGWYATDYAKGNGKAPKPDSKPADSNSSESGPAKSESNGPKADSASSSDSKPAASPKPESKPESKPASTSSAELK